MAPSAEKLVDIVLPVTAGSLAVAAEMLVGFVGALFLGALLLPGLERTGYPQPDGTTKEYKLTGMTLFFVAHMVVATLVFGFGVSLTPIVTHVSSPLVLANVVAVVLSLALHIWGRRDGSVLR